MSDTGRTKVDLSDRKRVGPESESREEQFEGGLADAPGGEARPNPASETPSEAHDIEHSNDLTTP